MTNPAALPTPVTLSARLRAGTQDQHRRAESTPFITALMGGDLHVEAYTDLAVQHHALYTALEAGGRAVAGAPGGSIVMPELVRAAAIDTDLTHLVGPDWRDRTRVLPSTTRYVTHLRRVAVTLPGFVAHAYTRYLGDLSGGLAVRAMLRRHYQVPDEALHFYSFPTVTAPKVFKDGYRARIDSLPLTPLEQDQVVAEAQVAFDHNTAVFTELGDRHLPRS
ncbi:heme oxygenase [Cellulomonas bogoriensis 69B4 = DSM 16987]|uniref:Heme oxygenase n=1 Tax=Cellulomonas bogoriensis 69B4 = DSM 16987 TaxID=1386082 RepID=A0A0A0BVQ9_9CELL|nr:biliverdin-producing heme oxygenase [Cellulomonas bogoriensis]KGM12031.1 heme oxygenase [Cellulomonas bogoriensis 69B4 = DSM 16987]